MLNSTRRSIPYPNPDRSDRPDIPLHIKNLVDALELDILYVQGTNAARLAAAHLAGLIWRETDTGNFYWDTGAAWVGMGTASSIVQSGTYAARPAFASVPAGTLYFATDTLGTFRSDGATAWTLVDQQPMGITPANLSTIPGLYTGQLIALQVDATNGVNWMFRYNAASASAYKWEFLGGPSMYSEVATAENTSSSTYAALTTAGPSITLPRSGDYEVFIGFEQGVSGTTGSGIWMSYDIGATPASDADGAVSSSPSSANLFNHTRLRRKTGLVAGDALVAKYRTAIVASELFAKRVMKITPIRIS